MRREDLVGDEKNEHERAIGCAAKIVAFVAAIAIPFVILLILVSQGVIGPEFLSFILLLYLSG